MRFVMVMLAMCAGLPLLAQVNKNDTIRTDYRPTDTLSTVHSKGETAIISEIEAANGPVKKMVYSPVKAGLYSAILPGLGQYYNKKYWKIPIVWGAIGTGVGFTLWLDKDYRRYRSAFLAELNGQPHEFSDRPYIDKVALANFQDTRKRQRDYAILISSAVYLLNIVDAVVDAHLYEGRHDPDLAVAPALLFNPYSYTQAQTAGVGIRYKF